MLEMNNSEDKAEEKLLAYYRNHPAACFSIKTELGKHSNLVYQV